MKKIFLSVFISTAFSLPAIDALSQNTDFNLISQIPKDTTLTFSLDYKISRPRLIYPDWDHDFDRFYSFLTPALRKTQAALSHNDKGIITTITPNSIIPHAQLDTLTIVNDVQKLIGTWRMVSFRSVRYNDSVYLPTKTYYRLDDVLLAEKSKDEAFAVFTNNNFTIYAKEAGHTKFKKVMSAKYVIENKRFIMAYKLIKAGAGVSQFGIDEKGFLILNYPAVIEKIKKGEYFSYYAVIKQYIFQKVN
ncbi:hypothetical protein [Niabella beijingensis]|uniref:hypothetical protein n=1 Tax=Niabella beijingensis TaxID=2872700 RepID=UPI001CC0DB95|nr:hypothetical protein [Niabella beijingensis]MBZ4191966.1 hypothetical protein [Niabella beijingensis]